MAGVGVHLWVEHVSLPIQSSSRFCVFMYDICRWFSMIVRRRGWDKGSVWMYLALATGHGDVDETTSVQNTLVGAALGGLLLLLGLNLYTG